MDNIVDEVSAAVVPHFGRVYLTVIWLEGMLLGKCLNRSVLRRLTPHCHQVCRSTFLFSEQAILTTVAQLRCVLCMHLCSVQEKRTELVSVLGAHCLHIS